MSASQRLSLAEDLTIYHALEQKIRLLDALATSDELEIDLLQVRAQPESLPEPSRRRFHSPLQRRTSGRLRPGKKQP